MREAVKVSCLSARWEGRDLGKTATLSIELGALVSKAEETNVEETKRIMIYCVAQFGPLTGASKVQPRIAHLQ